MDNNNLKKVKNSFIESFSVFFVVIFPILEPYSILGISITSILSMFIILLNFLYEKRIKISMKKEYMPLLIYVLLTCSLSLNGLLVLNNYQNLLNALVMQIVNIFAFIIAWQNIKFDKMISFADIVAYICSLYACLQFFMLVTGREVPIGKIPFLTIHTTWVPEIWGFRFNSLFSEPSYFAIFLIPIFTVHFLKCEWKRTILFGIFILLSSSSLGIIAMITIILMQLFNRNLKFKIKIKLLLGIICFMIALNFILNNSAILSNMLNRTLDKIIQIFDNQNNTNDLRLFGYLKYYKVLPLKEKILGVGISQLQNYYLEHGYSLSNYSNSFVLTLINSGIIGFAMLVIYLINLFKISRRNRTEFFFIILFLTLMVDSILIGYRFYWLSMYIYLFRKKED